MIKSHFKWFRYAWYRSLEASVHKVDLMEGRPITKSIGKHKKSRWKLLKEIYIIVKRLILIHY